MTVTHDIVQKLWSYCHILRDDGVTYHQYVTELTYLLFLKMAAETGVEDQLPDGCRWGDLKNRDGVEQLDFYRRMLIHLGGHGPSRGRAIFANAQTVITRPRTLSQLVTNIDGLDWYSARQEGLGDLYEGLLEKNAGEKKSGAGQYFTPRPLIDCMVRLMDPRPGEIIQDPAAGTGGFLIAADRHIKDRTNDLFKLTASQADFQRHQALQGMELVPDAHRLCLMNLMLHAIGSAVLLGDTLSPEGQGLPKANLILTNPPFGSKKGGGTPTRDDFTYPTANKQIAFLQHIYRGLASGGRAAVVLPDNILFEDNAGRQVRSDLMDKCDLHTILRLPTGIFYSQGVKTNVLFFTRGETDKGNTRATWIYDLRTNRPQFGKRTPLTAAAFASFERLFGDDPLARGRPDDATDAEDRWRRFSREALSDRADNLDITWLKDENTGSADDLPDPENIAAEIMANLRTAMEEVEALSDVLEGNNQETDPNLEYG